MSTSRILGFAFIALAASLFTADRISAQWAWASQRAAVAIHGSGSHAMFPDYTACYQNPATWLCLGIGLLLLAFGSKLGSKNK